MKTLKTVDVLGQAALIISLVIVSAIKRNSLFIYAYFIVGAWQVISMIVHQVNKWHTRKGTRRYYYHRITAFVLAAMALAYLVPYLFAVWYIMLFAAPVMAVYYTTICILEIVHAVKRPLQLI